MRPLLPLLLLLPTACGGPPATDTGGCDWPASPATPTGVVSETCGWYQLSVGQHLYVAVTLTEPESPCTIALGTGLAAEDPSYSYTGDEPPKWVYDIAAQSPGPDQEVDVQCEDGSAMQLKVDVG